MQEKDLTEKKTPPEISTILTGAKKEYMRFKDEGLTFRMQNFIRKVPLLPNYKIVN